MKKNYMIKTPLISTMSILMMISLIFTMTISLSIIGTASTNTSNRTIYHSDVDQDYGFYKIIDYTTNKPVSYVNKTTLTINVGDTVVWINDATPDEPLTIMSKEGLWGNRSAYLRWNYQRFSYTFNQSGRYEIYIKEYPRTRHQIIMVKGTEPIVTVVPTVIVTDTELPRTEISPIETVVVKKTQDSYVFWLLITAAGLMTYAIYESRKRKNK